MHMQSATISQFSASWRDELLYSGQLWKAWLKALMPKVYIGKWAYEYGDSFDMIIP